MSVNVERLEDNKVKISLEVPAELIQQESKELFENLKKKGQLKIPGFRPKKLTLQTARVMLGKGFLLEEGFNRALNRSVEKVYEDENLFPITEMQMDDVNGDLLLEGKDVPVSFTQEMEPKAELSTCEVKIPVVPRTASEQEVSEHIAKEQENNARYITVDDRPAAIGDFVTVSFTATQDGQPVENGTQENQRVELGKQQIYQGFTEALVGVSAGDHRDLHLPMNNGGEEAGEKFLDFAVDVVVVQRRELPELDDEFAQDVSSCETFEEYMAEVQKELDEKKAKEYDSRRHELAMESLLAGSTVHVPDAMVDADAKEQLDAAEKFCAENKISMDLYARYSYGVDAETLKMLFRVQALRQARLALVLREAADMAGLEPEEAELQERLEAEAASLKMPVANMLKQFPYAKRVVRDGLRKAMARKYVVEHAVEEEGYVIPTGNEDAVAENAE